MTSTTWLPVCSYTELLPEFGVAALVGGEQVALFRLHDGTVLALGNLDPYSGAYVLARGIVGSRAGAPTVASPMHKQVFDLRTGECLDEPGVAVASYPVRVRDGAVEVLVAAVTAQAAA